MIFSYFMRKLTILVKKDIAGEHLQLKQSLHDLQKEMESLKSQLVSNGIQEATNLPEDENLHVDKRIVIEKLIIETVNIENADLSNNFGNLGIRELQGQLYIGTTYDSLKTKEAMEKKFSGSLSQNNVDVEKSEHPSPKINILKKQSPPKL